MDLFSISAAEPGKSSRIPITTPGDSGVVFYALALEMAGAIRSNNAAGRRTVFICPVGPVGISA